jgi:integrase
VEKIGIAPRHLKGRRGRTRWVPVLPELARALQSHIGHLRRRFELNPDMPLFPSRKLGPDGSLRPLSSDAARCMLHRAFAKAGILNDGRLGCHTFRKTWARHVLKNSGNNVAVVKTALCHSSLDVTQRYIEIEEDEVIAAIRGCDFTRRPRLRALPPAAAEVPASTAPLSPPPSVSLIPSEPEAQLAG